MTKIKSERERQRERRVKYEPKPLRHTTDSGHKSFQSLGVLAAWLTGGEDSNTELSDLSDLQTFPPFRHCQGYQDHRGPWKNKGKIKPASWLS